jgi:hypothetical protein
VLAKLAVTWFAVACSYYAIVLVQPFASSGALGDGGLGGSGKAAAAAAAPAGSAAGDCQPWPGGSATSAVHVVRSAATIRCDAVQYHRVQCRVVQRDAVRFGAVEPCGCCTQVLPASLYGSIALSACTELPAVAIAAAAIGGAALAPRLFHAAAATCGFAAGASLGGGGRCRCHRGRVKLAGQGPNA